MYSMYSNVHYVHYVQILSFVILPDGVAHLPLHGLALAARHLAALLPVPGHALLLFPIGDVGTWNAAMNIEIVSVFVFINSLIHKYFTSCH